MPNLKEHIRYWNTPYWERPKQYPMTGFTRFYWLVVAYGRAIFKQRTLCTCGKALDAYGITLPEDCPKHG